MTVCPPLRILSEGGSVLLYLMRCPVGSPVRAKSVIIVMPICTVLRCDSFLRGGK